MQPFVIIISLFTALFSYADAGNIYRFNLELESKSGERLNGYYYHYSYDKYDENTDYGKRLENLLNKNSITIYTLIQTKNLGELQLDFTSNNYKIEIDLNNFKKIRIINYSEPEVYHPLVELSPKEFLLIGRKNPEIEFIYNQKIAENCNYILLCWNSKTDLSKHKKEISHELSLFSKNLSSTQNRMHKYLSLKKEELLNRYSILMINHCSAL
jgi:hypothetical protein